MTISARGLARRSVSPTGLWAFGVSASAPMVVLAGGITATYATGTLGVPLSFLILGAAIGLAAVGMCAMVRDTPPHAATLAALLTHGLGRLCGTAGAAVAVLSYAAIQISLYGLLGATVAPLLGGAWWAWALAGWALTATAGIAHLHANTWAVTAVLLAELAVIAGFVVSAFTTPTDPDLAWEPVAPDQVFTPGLGTVLALGVAAFIGAESVTAFGEETRSRAGIARAMTAVIASLTVLYAVSSWALALATGPTAISTDARLQGAELPITLLRERFGEAVAVLGQLLIVVSILGALLAFHHVVARYLYALGREGLLSPRLATIRNSRRSGHGGIPVIASAAQSLLALAVLIAAAVTGLDPMQVFVQLSTLAALGIMTLLVAVCVATIAYYARQTSTKSTTPWQRLYAPTLGAVAMAAVLIVSLARIDTTTDTALARWLLPVVIATAACIGAGRAAWLRRHRHGAWEAIGNGQPPPLAVIDRAYSDLDV